MTNPGGSTSPGLWAQLVNRSQVAIRMLLTVHSTVHCANTAHALKAIVHKQGILM